jgi:hypothetical protein
MWQSLSFGANYKSAYCMAVCPAGEDVIRGFLPNKKAFVDGVVRPLKERPEPIYVVRGTNAERVARKNPHKEVRHVRNPTRIGSIDGFVSGARVRFDSDRAKGLELCIQFQFTGPEARAVTVKIAGGELTVADGLIGEPRLQVTVDSRLWIRLANRELSPLATVWAVLTRKLKVRGQLRRLREFQACLV